MFSVTIHAEVTPMDDFFALPDEALFDRAARINGAKACVQASPTVIEERCKTDPPCRHCKWEHFKATGRQTGTPKTIRQTIDWVKKLEENGVQRTFVASGWWGYRIPRGFVNHVGAVRENSSLEIYALMGAIDKKSLAELAQAGLQGYLCGLESPNKDIYRRFRPGGDSQDDRITALYAAQELGIKVWSGFLIGFGETDEDIVQGIDMLIRLEPSSVSILPFIPFPYTGMADRMPANPLKWARAMAAATLDMPKADIFTDQGEGLYRPYGDLVKPNGFYRLPPFKA
jgi:biotin synthase